MRNLIGNLRIMIGLVTQQDRFFIATAFFSAGSLLCGACRFVGATRSLYFLKTRVVACLKGDEIRVSHVAMHAVHVHPNRQAEKEKREAQKNSRFQDFHSANLREKVQPTKFLSPAAWMAKFEIDLECFASRERLTAKSALEPLMKKGRFRKESE